MHVNFLSFLQYGLGRGTRQGPFRRQAPGCDGPPVIIYTVGGIDIVLTDVLIFNGDIIMNICMVKMTFLNFMTLWKNHHDSLFFVYLWYFAWRKELLNLTYLDHDCSSMGPELFTGLRGSEGVWDRAVSRSTFLKCVQEPNSFSGWWSQMWLLPFRKVV